jgi:hypothetical protein
MAKRNGNVTSALKDMLFNLIGRHTRKLAVQGNTNAIVEPYFLGTTLTFNSNSSTLFSHQVLFQISAHAFYIQYLKTGNKVNSIGVKIENIFSK